MNICKKLYSVILASMLTALPLAAAQPGERGLEYYLDKGYELFEAGNYRSARAEFVKAGELVTADDHAAGTRIAYLVAECSAKMSERDAMDILERFLSDHPNSIYSNDIRFAMGNLFYLRGDYEQARKQYVTMDPYSLRTAQQDEYNFKLGHSFFITEDYTNATASLRQVGPGSEYSPHARYYLAYMDYVNGNYRVAKNEFQQLASNASYEKLIPFYLLQIEFLEGNYDYVLRNGDALLSAATGERETEIARIMGEAWFHKGGHEQTLRYMNIYRNTGGHMGRAENYLVGYAQYMRNDIEDAISSLAQVVGPDDKLTQNAAYHLGGAYLRTGDKLRAMQSFSMAADARYDDNLREEALFNYGKLQYELSGGVFNEAINILTRYITEYPDSPRINQAREFLIAAYYNSRNYEAAYEAIRLIPDPDNNLKTAYQKIAYFRAMEYYNDGDLDTAYRLLEESLQNKFNPKYMALTQFWKAEILYRRGDYAKAIPLYEQYLKLAPASEKEYRMAQYNIGYSYFNLERYGEARTWFDRFLSGNRNNDRYKADALNRVGDAFYAVRDFAKAVDNYDAAARLGTRKRFYARYQRAIALGLTGSNTRKADALRDIISAGEGDYVDDAMYELGRTYIGMERFDDGAATLKQYIDKFPTGEHYLASLSELGLAYQNMNNDREALKYYQMLVDRSPASKEARDAMLAVKSIYIDMNDVDGYFAFAGKAGIETDTGVIARDSLSYASAERIYMTSNDKARIITAWKDYLDKYPRGAYRPNALYNLSDTYLNAGQADNAMEPLKELSEMPYNGFTVRGLEKLAPLAYDRRRYGEAADAYKKLAATAVNPETSGNAWGGYLRSIVAGGDENATAAAADEVLAAKSVPAAVEREAKSIKAGALQRRGDNAGALALYKQLATEVQTAEGAQATYMVIQSMYDCGDLDGAEKMVLDFAKQNSPQSYWLGRSFLTLGDVYIKKGDNFQARATLQSVVDGYSPADDGIVAGAKERIGRLGE